MRVEPVNLAGQHVRLEPLQLDHVDELGSVALEPELWKWTIAAVTSREDLARYVEAALAQQRNGSALPFLIRELASGAAVGCTRYGNIDVQHRRVEIGWSWVGRRWQRTPINTEAKYLLLKHAFETLHCIRVEFKTDVLNTTSRAALRRLGAVEEGVLRGHIVTDSGRVRDTVYYSILEMEWPRVRVELEARLQRPYGGATELNLLERRTP